MKFIDKIKCAAVSPLVMLAATTSSYFKKSREKDGPSEEFVDVPGIGQVPKELCDKGLGSVDSKTASAINSVYLLSRNYDQGRRVSKVPANIAEKAQNCFLSVEDGPYKGTYDRDNIWDTIENSRTLFAEQIMASLMGMSKPTYEGLNPNLKEIVDQGREIVDKTLLG